MSWGESCLLSARYWEHSVTFPLFSRLQEEFTLTTKESVPIIQRENILTELENDQNLDFSTLSPFQSPHALLGLFSLGCIAFQMVAGENQNSMWQNMFLHKIFLAGLVFLIFPCFGRIRSSYLPLHTFFGLALFIRYTASKLFYNRSCKVKRGWQKRNPPPPIPPHPIHWELKSEF